MIKAAAIAQIKIKEFNFIAFNYKTISEKCKIITEFDIFLT